MRTCNEHEITIEQLMNVVHNYTDPIRIRVVMDDAWLTCEEAKHMHNFYLTERYSYTDVAEEKRLLKYYKDVPVWNLAVWMDCDLYSKEGRAIYTGIEAHCHYKDIREGYLAERADIKRESRREYYRRKKLQTETAAMLDMMDEACPRVLATGFAVLAFVMLVMHYFVCEPAPLPVIVEVCCPSLSY